jgi:hypothetical protein
VAVVSMSKQEFSRLEVLLTVRLMSDGELRRLEVLLRVQSGGVRIADACELIGLHRRQVFRLLRGLKRDGAASLLSKRRGKPSNHRLPAPHQPRRRRDCLGELVQIDGSEHAWFEDRGPPCTLLGFVDDATSRRSYFTSSGDLC